MTGVQTCALPISIAMASNDDGLRLSEKEFPVALADFEQEDRVLEDDQYDMTAPRVETR